MPKNCVYAVYDMKNYEQCICVFETAKEVAKRMGIVENTVYADAHRNNWVKKRYKIKKIEIKEG